MIQTRKILRPGRDLNPGQKIRNLLGCPLPHRDTEFLTVCLTKIAFIA
jgi:hypothetical protein